MVDITQKFLNDIDIISGEITEDNGYFAIYLCQKITDKYIEENNGSILETMKIFMKICNEDINLIKYLSLLCIYVTQLRLGKMNKDEKLIRIINNLIKKIDEI